MQEENKKTEKKKKILTAKSASEKRPKEKPSKMKKKKKRISSGVLASIVFIIVIAGVFAMVYFNIGESKQAVIELFALDIAPDVRIVSANEMLEEALTKQEELELEIEALESQIDVWEEKDDELEDIKKDLAKKEKELSELEVSLTGTGEDGEVKDSNLMATVEIFEEMDTVKAAEAIGGMKTVQEKVLVLVNMQSDNAASILDQMDKETATAILSEMIN